MFACVSVTLLEIIDVFCAKSLRARMVTSVNRMYEQSTVQRLIIARRVTKRSQFGVPRGVYFASPTL